MIGVAILGCGVVGSGVAEAFRENGYIIDGSAGGELRLTHVVELRAVPVPEGAVRTRRFEDVLETPEVRIVVETIGGVGVAYDFTRRALESGRHVVTSNKELVSAKGDELCALAEARGVHYLYEASVGGGIPILGPIARSLCGNRIDGIDGIVNGSTNYLLTRMEADGWSFDRAAKEASSLGYLEENPAADVEGWDARRKLAILANACFGSRFADESSIPTVGITGIKREDLDAAKRLGYAVKLIARAERAGEGWHGWVRPAAVPMKSPIAVASDAYNAIRIRGNFVGDAMFYGLGAGSRPTASAVIGDVIEAARRISSPPAPRGKPAAPRFAPQPDRPVRYLFRITDETLFHEARSAFVGCETVVFVREGGYAILTPQRAESELRREIDGIFRHESGRGALFEALPD